MELCALSNNSTAAGNHSQHSMDTHCLHIKYQGIKTGSSGYCRNPVFIFKCEDICKHTQPGDCLHPSPTILCMLMVLWMSGMKLSRIQPPVMVAWRDISSKYRLHVYFCLSALELARWCVSLGDTLLCCWTWTLINAALGSNCMRKRKCFTSLSHKAFYHEARVNIRHCSGKKQMTNR